jgi:hypothetical protein
MLILLILGKESIKSNNVDVYLAPLVEELQELWKGVDTWDICRASGKRRFTLRTILIWAIHDLPTYGLLSRKITKWYKGCPTCGPSTTSQYSKCLGKMIYFRHQRLLRPNHPMRTRVNDFDGKVEHRSTPNVI